MSQPAYYCLGTSGRKELQLPLPLPLPSAAHCPLPRPRPSVLLGAWCSAMPGLPASTCQLIHTTSSHLRLHLHLRPGLPSLPARLHPIPSHPTSPRRRRRRSTRSCFRPSSASLIQSPLPLLSVFLPPLLAWDKNHADKSPSKSHRGQEQPRLACCCSRD